MTDYTTEEREELLADLLNLKKGWDSYGADPIEYAAVQVARRISIRYPNLWIVPLNDGGLQMEIHLKGGDFEFEIEPDGTLGSFYLVTNEPGGIHTELEADAIKEEDIGQYLRDIGAKVDVS